MALLLDTVRDFASDPLVAFLVVFIFNVVQQALQHCLVDRSSPDIAALEAEAAALRLEAARNNTPDTFTTKARAERKAIAVDKRTEQLKAKQEANRRHLALKAAGGAKTLTWLALAVANWGRPLVLVSHADALWPLGRMLAAPHGALRGVPGAIAAMPWLVMCDRASRSVLRAALGLA